MTPRNTHHAERTPGVFCVCIMQKWLPVSCKNDSCHAENTPMSENTPEWFSHRNYHSAWRFSHHAERSPGVCFCCALCRNDSLYHARMTPVMQKTLPCQKILRSGFRIGIIILRGVFRIMRKGLQVFVFVVHYAEMTPCIMQEWLLSCRKHSHVRKYSGVVFA